jgi:hypothetical protein
VARLGPCQCVRRAALRASDQIQFRLEFAHNESAFHPEDEAVSKVRAKVIPEPVKKPPFDTEAWFARLDELGGCEFLPEGISDEPPEEPDSRVFFGE